MVYVVRHDPPGALSGSVLGIAAGLLLGAIWSFGSGEVALAVTAVFLGLVAVLVAGNPGWRRFGVAFVLLAALAGGGLGLLVWSAASPGIGAAQFSSSWLLIGRRTPPGAGP